MDAVLAQRELSPAETYAERRREVLLERLRSMASRSPEVLGAVIQRWIEDDQQTSHAERLESYERRRRLIESSEWYSHIQVHARPRNM